MAREVKINPLKPNKELAAAVAINLYQRYKTFNTVNTVYSSLVACLRRAKIDVTCFNEYQLENLFRSLNMDMRTPVTKATPISPDLLRKIVSHMRRYEREGRHIATAVLFLFASGLRQSNVLPNSVEAFDPKRQVTRADITWAKSHYVINIKWEKPKQGAECRAQPIPTANDSTVCSYTALSHMWKNSVKKSPNTPLICFEDGNPIPLPYFRQKWKNTLQAIGIHDKTFTIHGLRRGNARFLQDMGLEVSEIKTHIGWESDAVFGYIPKPAKKTAFKALKRL